VSIPWRMARPVVGLAILAGVAVSLDWTVVTQMLSNISKFWLLIALLLAILGNLLCALRWASISFSLGIGETVSRFLTLYGQGIAINSVIPGGVIGGDAWRASQLSKAVPIRTRVRSVFLDRLSGLWSLSLLGLLGFLLVGFESLALASFPRPWFHAYLFGLMAIGCIPLLYKLGGVKANGLSLASQAATILAFWSCMQAVGAAISVGEMLLVSLAIFLVAMIPASVGGFGVREGASVVFMSFFGVSAESATLGSILFGFAALIQGLLAILIWSSPQFQHDPSTNNPAN